MNKAEEQFLYNLQRIEGKAFVMKEGYMYKREESFIDHLNLSLQEKLSKSSEDIFEGATDYLNTILQTIDFGVIKDWPSFVEYMTGEDYAVDKPVCETCEGSGEVSAPYYSSKGEAPDCDIVRCPRCGVDDE